MSDKPAMTAFSDETGRERVTADMLRAARRKAPKFWRDYDGSEQQMRAVIEAALSATPVEMWKCAARKQSLPEPADCGWPTCGCDPYADKVIAALEEQGLPASPVAQEGQLLTLLDAATVTLHGLIERPGENESWDEANKLLPKLLSRLERRGDECCAHGVELHQDCYRCDEGPPAPVAQEPVADELLRTLREHHNWHLQAGTIGLQDGDGGWIEIDNAAEYTDSALYERTAKLLEGAPPEEHQPMPRGGMNTWWWEQAVLLRRKVRELTKALADQQSYADLRASGGIFPEAYATTPAGGLGGG